MATPDVLIVGGGIVGAAVARALAIEGVAVEIVDSGAEPGIATQASAGMLAPLIEMRESEALMGLAIRGRDLYRELAPALREESGVDIGLWMDGILRLAFSEDDEVSLRNAVAWQRQQGFNTEWLSAGELRQRCPGVSAEARGAKLAPEDGALTPLAALEALLVSAAARGTRLVRGETVLAVETDEGQVTGVRTRTGHRPAGAVVVAAGCWSGRLGGLPRPLSVEPVRGQMLAYDWPEQQPPAILYGGGGYLLKRGSEVLVGATMEFMGFDASTTPSGEADLAVRAARIFPTLAKAPIRRRWSGLRPCTPDGRPMVGQDPDLPNLWYATGHGRNGVLLAPVTGDIISRQMRGTPEADLGLDLAPLEPGRFWRY